MSDNTIAKTILYQIGGNKFIVMTGSKNFLYGDNYLLMTLSQNKSGANRLKITLDPSDTYTMQFLKYRPFETEIVKEFSDVYCDQLQDIFEKVTGLYTTLSEGEKMKYHMTLFSVVPWENSETE